MVLGGKEEDQAPAILGVSLASLGPTGQAMGRAQGRSGQSVGCTVRWVLKMISAP